MGGKSSTQKTENKPPKWATPLFQESASEAQRIYDSGAGGNVYQGQTVAGLGGTTKSGISGIRSAAAGFNDPDVKNNLTDWASGNNVMSNPHFNEALQGQLDDTAAQVQSQFSGAGRYGSGANTGVLANKLGNIRAGALSNQYNQDVGNMFTAGNALTNWNQANLGAQGAVTEAGQIEDQNKQAQLTADFTKWQSKDMQPWTRLGLLQSAAAGSAGNYGTNTQTQTQPFNAMQGIGALGSMFTKSDARLKAGIKPIGVKNGHTIYEWRYVGSSMRFRGVMAQDVIDINPSAVISQNGYYAVDYSRLGLEMEAA
ncbi:tail fiber domain-containing protein [Rhizobium leguminosarum]|uniref:tail fiber domain-containing protein n=1 Tax=Rhizobium leguminosarum TaxID=384 RepID=UPI001C973D20|nr:tail fiber domain-containing protein [Rhizobium leguminosarum]MBY5821486.1 tail fiber domain-containing protein [Rhizobium leguminosarum]